MRLLIHTDGAARGNPGPAGAGAILRDAADGAVLAEIAEPLGHATEQRRGVDGGTPGARGGPAPRGHARRPAHGLGARRAPDHRHLSRQASGPQTDPRRGHGAAAALDGYTVGHVPRELNKDADRLSNVAIDGADAPRAFEPGTMRSLEAAGRPRAHRSKGRARGKSELHRAGQRVTPVRREARTSATVTMPPARRRSETRQALAGARPNRGAQAARSAPG